MRDYIVKELQIKVPESEKSLIPWIKVTKKQT